MFLISLLTCWYFGPLNIFTTFTFISMIHLNEYYIGCKIYYPEKVHLAMCKLYVHMHILYVLELIKYFE